MSEDIFQSKVRYMETCTGPFLKSLFNFEGPLWKKRKGLGGTGS